MIGILKWLLFVCLFVFFVNYHIAPTIFIHFTQKKDKNMSEYNLASNGAGYCEWMRGWGYALNDKAVIINDRTRRELVSVPGTAAPLFPGVSVGVSGAVVGVG